MKKILLLIVASSILLGLICISWEYYRAKHAELQWERNEVLKKIRIQSKTLEQRAKFLDIKLGSDIKEYIGFEKLDPLSSPSSLVDEGAGEESWGYFGNSSKYSSVGPFNLLNPVFEIEMQEGKFGQRKYQNSSKVALTVFTFKGKIYTITAKIKAAGNYTTSSNRFNNFLHSAYGPCVTDNGHNDINYSANDELVWESQNVTLTTKGEFVENYIKVNGRVQISGFDHITNIKYIHKPLSDELARFQANQANKIIGDGIEKL